MWSFVEQSSSFKQSKANWLLAVKWWPLVIPMGDVSMGLTVKTEPEFDIACFLCPCVTYVKLIIISMYSSFIRCPSQHLCRWSGETGVLSTHVLSLLSQSFHYPSVIPFQASQKALSAYSTYTMHPPYNLLLSPHRVGLRMEPMK